MQFLIGQVMRTAQGKANPRKVSEMLQARLASDAQEPES
ncbi:MAG: hypothetical protein ABR497_09905 [Kiritimatiellia bacterium]